MIFQVGSTPQNGINGSIKFNDNTFKNKVNILNNKPNLGIKNNEYIIAWRYHPNSNTQSDSETKQTVKQQRSFDRSTDQNENIIDIKIYNINNEVIEDLSRFMYYENNKVIFKNNFKIAEEYKSINIELLSSDLNQSVYIEELSIQLNG